MAMGDDNTWEQFEKDLANPPFDSSFYYLEDLGANYKVIIWKFFKHRYEIEYNGILWISYHTADAALFTRNSEATHCQVISYTTMLETLTKIEDVSGRPIWSEWYESILDEQKAQEEEQSTVNYVFPMIKPISYIKVNINLDQSGSPEDDAN